MGGGHHLEFHHLRVDRDTALHRLGADAKVVALVVFVVAVAITPRHAVWAFGVYVALLAAVLTVGRIPPAIIARRVLIVSPFLLVAALVPFISDGATTRVGPLTLSTEGLWAGWNIAAKALLGATASVTLMASTSIAELLRGLSRLHVPALIVSIVAFMVRYLDLIVDQLHRMRASMTARCHDPRWLWQAKPIAASAGALFVRSYERGERIHHAMLARGFTGAMPDLNDRRTTLREWAAALVVPVLAAGTAIVALAR